MNIKLLNDKTLKILKGAGWYSGRKINYLVKMKKLENEGYESFEYAHQIMEEIGELKIVGGPTILFDAYYVGTGDFEYMKDVEKIINECAFPIGEYYQKVIYVGISKKIYIRDCEDMYFVADSIEEGLNLLCDTTFVPELIGTIVYED